MNRTTLLSLALLTAGVTAANAANITWDVSPGTVGAGNSTITGGTGTWNLANGNWTVDAGANNIAWDNTLNAADIAVFQGTGGTVTLNNGGAAINAGGVTFATASYVLAGATATDVLAFGGNQGAITSSALGTTGSNLATVSANLTGTAGLTIASHGNLTASGGSSGARLVVSGDNTGLTGGIAITSGLVNFTTSAAAGSASTTAGSGNQLTLSNGGGLLWTGTGTQTLGNNVVLSTGGGTFRVYGTQTLVLNGALSGSTGFNKTDGGTLVLNGTNTYDGATNVQGGIVRLGSASALGSTTGGTVVSSGTTLDLNGQTIGAEALTLSGTLGNTSATAATLSGAVTLAGNSTVNGTGNTTLSGGVGGAFALTKNDAGSLTLSGTNTYTGITTVNGGALDFGSTGSLANNANFLIRGATASVGTGASLNTGTGQIKVGDLAAVTATLNQTGGTIATTNTIFVADAATTTIGNVNLSGGSLSTTGILLVATRGTGTVNISGTAAVSANRLWFGHNSVSGATTNGTVNLNGGTLTVGGIEKPGAIGTSTFNFNGGTLKASQSNAFFLAGNNGSTGSAAITRANVRDGGAKIDTNGFNVTIGQALVHSNIGGDNATDGGLTKSGAGTLTLTGTNSYTDATAVNAGTLLINGNSSTVIGTATVASGATFGGTHSYGGAVTVAGTLAPGASIESLTTGTVTFNDGATYDWEMADTTSTGADLLAINGDLNLNGTVTLQVTDSGTWNLGDKLTLISYTGSWNGGLFTLDGNELVDNSTFSFSSLDWLIDYDDTIEGSNYDSEAAGSFVTITAVPEPSVALLGALGVMLIFRRRMP